MGRHREFDEVQALEQAMNLFWAQGYEATSLQDLLETMGLAKSSFYQTFASKHQLLERSIEHYRHIIVDDMVADLEQAASGMQFIRDTLSGVAERTNQPNGRRGCLVVNCANEFAQSDAVVAELVSNSFAEFKAIFFAGVQQAQREGDILVNRNADALADYLVTCKSGLETMAKAGVTAKVLTAIIESMMSALV